jgi:hypothetical protein
MSVKIRTTSIRVVFKLIENAVYLDFFYNLPPAVTAGKLNNMQNAGLWSTT